MESERKAMLILAVGIALLFESISAQSVSSIISKYFFNTILNAADSSCAVKNFYAYDAFIQAANAYSGFGTTGTSDDGKRELAAFFAHVTHETASLCYIEEIDGAKKAFYDESSTQYPCVAGKTYFGRGPFLLTFAITSGKGFGATIQAVSGAIECTGRSPDIVNTRIKYYKNYCLKLGVDPGSNLSC
ncbi:hypothetical protein SUGI_0430290 [Cryptomeria japonica]|nr:hypothetical protein SUGI_0430290 [Cryptomeria japonica]